MAPQRKLFGSATESTCVSEIFAEDALYYPVTGAAMPSILVGEKSKDESNGEEYLRLPCQVFWWA